MGDRVHRSANDFGPHSGVEAEDAKLCALERGRDDRGVVPDSECERGAELAPGGPELVALHRPRVCRTRGHAPNMKRRERVRHCAAGHDQANRVVERARGDRANAGARRNEALKHRDQARRRLCFGLDPDRGGPDTFGGDDSRRAHPGDIGIVDTPQRGTSSEECARDRPSFGPQRHGRIANNDVVWRPASDADRRDSKDRTGRRVGGTAH